MTSKKLSTAVFLIGAFVFAAPPSAQAAPHACGVSERAAAESFVRDLHDHVSGEAVKEAAPQSNLNAFIRANVPVDAVSRFALGVHWRQATESQRAEYQKLFGETVFPALTEQILRYRKAAYTIVDNRRIQSNDRLVTANVTGAKGGILKVGWRLNIQNCAATATDMIVDGVSLMVMKRQEFASVISGQGIDGLLKKMRAKAGRIKDGNLTGRSISQSEMGEIMQDLLRGAASKIH